MPALDPIASKRIAARRLIVYRGVDDERAAVYQVRRIRSEDLQAAGFGEILGPAALERAQLAAQRIADQEHLVATAETETARAEREAELAEMLEEENRRALEELTADEERTRTLLARCEAYLQAAVTAFGVARDGIPVGIVKRGVAPAEVCIPLDPDRDPTLVLRDGRFVPGPDARDGEIPLSEVPATERIALGMLVMAALEVAAVLQPFRGADGAAAAR